MTNYKEREQFFLNSLESNYDQEEIALIKKSLNFAFQKHENQKRKSGEPFIIHPLETAIKLVEWKMDVTTICAGLLHDILEDTEVTEEELIELFGNEITVLVQMVTKISLIAKKNREQNQLKNLNPNYQIQVFLSISKDIRAIIIKLADRFHNLSTIQFLNPIRQKAIAQETFDIYANIAGRLGMYNVKTQLLDQAFHIINYEAYTNTVSIINEYRLINEDKWKKITDKIHNLLNDENIKYKFEDRIKGIYSTYNKLNSISRINNIHDVYALRIILDNELDIYHVLGLIHLNFKYIPKFFKDYVSAPKNNLYQSIHTTIIDEKTLVEIQIRTKWMDANSRLGLASHWRYKEEYKTVLVNEASKIFQLDLFLNSTKKDTDLIKELTKIPVIDVIVTNNQNTYNIPASSTVLDLAYQVDPEQFKYIENIFRFGEKIPWGQNLDNGDVIEITYNKNPTIRENWNRYVSNPTIRKHINQIVSNLEITQYNSVQNFLDEVAKTLKDNQISNAEMLKRLKILQLNSIKEYLSYINVLHLSSKDQIDFFSKSNIWKSVLKEIRKHSNRWVFNQSFFEVVEGLKINSIQIPRCCSKLPYMQVVGIKERSQLYVHNPTCRQLHKFSHSNKLIPLRWNKKKLETLTRKFWTHVEIKGSWSESVVNSIVLNIIKNQGSLNEISISKNKTTQEFCANVILYVYDMNHLERIMSEMILRNINFIWKMI
ncbi:RelA/SpoT family protein [Mycoplasmoides pirum]|uniref:RelA/SpoT family protein n=1 Tax=Mycoplasmoides pirum TaxID=2122 RepID=UPI000696A5C4|nr:RelA/SpoT family protein [Mycoplasmoides pirum]